MGIYTLGGRKDGILTRSMHSRVDCSIIHNTQDMETTQMIMVEEIRKIWYMYTMKCYSAMRKEDSFLFLKT